VAPVAINTSTGWYTLRGYVSDATPGLAVTPVRNHDGWWGVTHVPSGRFMVACSQDAENVIGLAVTLAALGDWTRDANAVWSDRAFCKKASALLRQALESGEYKFIDGPEGGDEPPHVLESIRASRAAYRAEGA
jgi:hypothetical protein